MAGTAGLRNISVSYFRLGIARRQNGVDVTMAILALGDVGIACRCCFGMDAMIVGCLLITVAGCANGLRRSGVVGEGFDVGVAVDATERAVDGSLESSVVDMQTDLFAIVIFGQSCIIVTGQALLVAHFGGGFRLTSSRRKHTEQQEK